MFKLDDSYVEMYRGVQPNWGWPSGPNSLGELTYYRTYSRRKADGTNEQWFETVRRVVEGTYDFQRKHALANNRPWDEQKAKASANEMYERIFNFKFLPPGRGLWVMGTDYVRERGGAALQNCGFRSTDFPEDPAAPYAWMMDMLMLGVGIGADMKGAGQTVLGPAQTRTHTFIVPDSREGWVAALHRLLDSYFLGLATVEFDYSEVRPYGAEIKGFGGTASGPEPLAKMLESIRNILDDRIGGDIGVRAIADIANLIGCCVVAGNVRRSAEILAGPPTIEFLELKDYNKHPDRAAHGWASNNSILVEDDSDVIDWNDIARRVATNGEPGVLFMNNTRKYARMGDHDTSDRAAAGYNPCAEQPLHDGELCCLVETFPTNHDSLEDYLRTLKFAYLYAKTVTLVETHDEFTNSVMRRNRRIGTSASGIVQFMHRHDEPTLRRWLDTAYHYVQNLDAQYSEWLDVPESIRTTTVKPSGTVSLLAGATPGVHYPVADYYIRRVRVPNDSPLVDIMRDAGYHVEPDVFSANTQVVELPIKGEGLTTEREVSVYDKLEVAKLMARHWADNAVSVTVTFREDEVGDIAGVLEDASHSLKTISLLPIATDTYAQMPYEEISPDRYYELVDGLGTVDWSAFHGDGSMERFCTTDKCELPA